MALNTKTISAGVGDILNLDSGIDASTARNVLDGDGTASPLWLTTTKLGIGGAPSYLLTVDEDGADATVSVDCHSDTEAHSPILLFSKSDGTKASPTAVDDGAYLGWIKAFGHDGTDYATLGAGIRFEVNDAGTGSITTNRMPTDMQFLTSAGASDNDNAVKMTLSADGKLGVGVADPDTTLEVLSTTTQLKLSYDADSFATITVADSSNMTIATGESGTITISDATTFSNNLTVTGTTTLNDHITVAENKKIYFDSTDTYIYANTDGDEDLVIGADDDIILEPDGEVTVSAGNLALTDGNLVVTAGDHGIIHSGSGTVTQGTSITTGVTLNTTSGIITMQATAISADENIEFTVTNSTVQADSVILLSMQDENTVDNTQLVCATHTIAGGSFKITVANTDSAQASSATAVKIHFLVINNS